MREDIYLPSFSYRSQGKTDTHSDERNKVAHITHRANDSFIIK